MQKQERISLDRIAQITWEAFKNEELQKGENAWVFYDIDFLQKRIERLKAAFPANTLHAIAMKANPLTDILNWMTALDVGAEVASLPELKMALDAGYTPNKIVFDSPCKTVDEIAFALQKGIRLNADSFEELHRIDELLKIGNYEQPPSLGLRINPQTGTGQITSTSVAGQVSKFGEPLKDFREKIIDAYLQYNWLNAIHVHIGSQGCPPDMLVKGIGDVVALADEINEALERNKMPNRIQTFDMGGGLPVTYHFNDSGNPIEDYQKQLQEALPQLFDGRYQLITEFGRHIHANAAWALSRVEYVKEVNGQAILVNHLGADFMLRECYNPNDWHHEISLVDAKGNLKTSNQTTNYHIAGPLCFAGDFISRGVKLPKVETGDYLIIHDVGAYTLGMWSRYNSRVEPRVITDSNSKNKI